MKKAKIILTVITALAVIGCVLAFKTSRYGEFQLWTLNGMTSTVILTTTIGGLPVTYTATVPYCKTTNLWPTDDGVVLAIARITVPSSVKGTLIGGTATTLMPYLACPTFLTFVTIIL
jgi:hypothetical protein